VRDFAAASFEVSVQQTFPLTPCLRTSTVALHSKSRQDPLHIRMLTIPEIICVAALAILISIVRSIIRPIPTPKNVRNKTPTRAAHATPSTVPTRAAVSRLPRECSVCGDVHPAAAFPDLRCDHNADVCRTCFPEWLSAQVGTIQWDRIRCPSSNCMTAVPYHIVKDCAPAEVFTQFVHPAYLYTTH